MISAILKGLALGLLISLAVGPVVFSIIRQSLNNGHKGGFAFVAGVSASDILMVLICNVFGQLFQMAMSHEKTIGIIGSCFLIGMGLFNIFFKKQIRTNEIKLVKRFRKRDIFTAFFSGFFMNLLNPGVFLFWFAATATILEDSKSVTHPVQYRLIVFATCLTFILCTDVLKVILAGKIRPKLTPHNIHIIDRISGAILITFGIILMWNMLWGRLGA
jgi:threonine/homoserine/homoserine lactone efflux protein